MCITAAFTYVFTKAYNLEKDSDLQIYSRIYCTAAWVLLNERCGPDISKHEEERRKINYNSTKSSTYK
jgi:hypothetical protein